MVGEMNLRYVATGVFSQTREFLSIFLFLAHWTLASLIYPLSMFEGIEATYLALRPAS